jgi:hypothetical protein
MLVMLLVANILLGCAAREATSPAPAASDGSDLGGHIKRGMEKPKVQNVLDQLAKFYQIYNTENGRSPASWKDLKAYMQKEAPTIVRTIDGGGYEIVWNARLGADVVLAYEKEPDLRGSQVVVFGDGHIESMTPAKLQAALEHK